MDRSRSTRSRRPPAGGGRGGGGGQPAGGGPIPSIETRTAGMQKIDGFFPLYWEERTGSLFVEIPKLRHRLPVEHRARRRARLERHRPRSRRRRRRAHRLVPARRPARPDGAAATCRSARAARIRSSASRSRTRSRSRCSGASPSPRKSNGRVLVDATDFLLRDVTGAGNALRPGQLPRRSHAQRLLPAAHQGVSQEHRSRDDADLRQRRRRRRAAAATRPDRSRARRRFPRAAAARGGGGGGRGGGLFSGSVASVTPIAEAVTMREHASFVELPDNNYKPRYDDPRAGYGGLTFVDYSVPIGEPMQMRYIRRHRLREEGSERGDQRAGQADSGTWVDSGAPEDVKKALVEGASWWNQAFEAAGFRNALQGRRAARRRRPDGHPLQHDQLGPPLDARLELRRIGVRSAHRRDHQGDGHARLAARSPGLHDLRRPDCRRTPPATRSRTVLYQTALKRIRQLSAHEVGHTLGLGHNYYDSDKGWISVMDYPHPLEKLNADGTIDLSDAYPQQIGDWDKVAINYGYRAVPAGHRREGGADEDPRRRVGAGPALLDQPGHRHSNPKVDQWSNGADQADELYRLMKVRRAALNTHRRAHDPRRRADGDDRRAAGADLHVSPLRGGSRRRR